MLPLHPPPSPPSYCATSSASLRQVVRRNLLLADWCDDTHNQSFLSKKNPKYAREVLNNVRQACCVAGIGRGGGVKGIWICVEIAMIFVNKMPVWRVGDPQLWQPAWTLDQRQWCLSRGPPGGCLDACLPRSVRRG